MNKKRFKILSIIIFMIAFFSLVLFINAKMDHLLDSDEASELVLGKLLATENGILSKNWHYSSELRVINTQLFYALFFKVFENWHVVRIASYICLYLVLIVTYYLLCKSLQIKRYFWITAVLLLIPFSQCYFQFFLKGAYYIPHVSITFFSFWLCEKFIDDKDKKKTACNLLFCIIFPILVGLGGARQIFVLYIPLILVSLYIIIKSLSVINGKLVSNLKDDTVNKKFVLFSFISFLSAAIGFLINNKVLSKIYTFRSYDSLCFFEVNFSRIETTINGLLSSYGYDTGYVMSPALFFNVVCFCWIILTIYSCVVVLKKGTNSQRRFAMFTIAVFATFEILYIFTNMNYSERYNLMNIVLSIPMIALLFENSKFEIKLNDMLLGIFVILVCCSGFFIYKTKYNTDETGDLRKIVDVLKEQKYSNGYATFWNANVLTELSNGDIDVWCWQNTKGDEHITVSDINETFKWLQLVSHDYTHPEGKTFLLFSTTEWENNPWKDNLNTDNIRFESNEYILVGYDSYDMLLEDTSK